MKNATQDVKYALQGQNIQAVADCITFWFPGETQRYTTWSSDLSFGGNTWAAGTVIMPGNFRTALGLSVDTKEITIAPETHTVGGVPMKLAAARGMFDDVPVTVERAYMPTPGTVPGLVPMFRGIVVDVEPASTKLRVVAKAGSVKFETQLPRRLREPRCGFSIYDNRCGVTKMSETRTVATGSTNSKIVLSSASAYAVPGSWLEIGTAYRTIQAVSGAECSISPRLRDVPAVGATVTVVRGCDGTYATCKNVFNNLLRFGGLNGQPSSVA